MLRRQTSHAAPNFRSSAKLPVQRQTSCNDRASRRNTAETAAATSLLICFNLWPIAHTASGTHFKPGLKWVPDGVCWISFESWNTHGPELGNLEVCCALWPGMQLNHCCICLSTTMQPNQPQEASKPNFHSAPHGIWSGLWMTCKIYLDSFTRLTKLNLIV